MDWLTLVLDIITVLFFAYICFVFVSMPFIEKRERRQKRKQFYKDNPNTLFIETFYEKVNLIILGDKLGEKIEDYRVTTFEIFPLELVVQHQEMKRLTMPRSYVPKTNVPTENIRGYFHIDKLNLDPYIVIHFEDDGRWKIIKLDDSDFDDKRQLEHLLTMLTIVTEPEVKLAYARKPPYVHRDLTSVHYARQRITGDWEILAPLQLYLMPTYLVFLDEEGNVQRKISTEVISEIEALPRMDVPDRGILRFRAAGELFTFALVDYEAWADDLALAASKAQEIPLEADILEIKKKQG